MPARARATVSSSSSPPSCMMKGDLARSEVLADEDARDEGKRDEHVGRDVELGHKADDGL